MSSPMVALENAAKVLADYHHLSDSEKSAMFSDLVHVASQHLAKRSRQPTVDDLPLNVNELIAVTAERALKAVNGNRAKAAELMGVGERTLYRWLKHGLGDDATPAVGAAARAEGRGR